MSRAHDAARIGGIGLRPEVVIDGEDPILPSRLHIGEAAAATLGWIGQGIAAIGSRGGGQASVETSVVDGARAIVSFGLQRINGQPLGRTNQSNPLVRMYQAGDGRWVYIHGGFPGLAAGLVELLDLAPTATDPADVDWTSLDFETVGAAVGMWEAQALEDAAAARGLCCVVVRTATEWLAHPHGAALADQPLVRVRDRGDLRRWAPDAGGGALSGLRVLDLTRVLAGPTCGRTLAAFGADVLQISAPQVPRIEAFVIDTGHGKRRSLLDLTRPDELERVRDLALRADVVVQGNRPAMVDRFGLDEDSLRSDGWGGSYVSISCFGETGPFSTRPGWEQLAQSTTGLTYAEAGIAPGSVPEADLKPVMIPAAATDYTTGLLMAGALLESLGRGKAARIDASLCQTAMWLQRLGNDVDPTAATGLGEPDLARYVTDFGELDVNRLGIRIDGERPTWGWGARPFAVDQQVDWTHHPA